MSDTATSDAAANIEGTARGARRTRGWRLEARTDPALPQRAWIARIGQGNVEAAVGRSVRVEDGGLFEGTWAGPSGIASAAQAATVFGSGLVLGRDEVTVVPPAHTLEPIYYSRDADGALIVGNSFPGLLEAMGVGLIDGVAYPTLFGKINRGLSHLATGIPTSAAPITAHHFENLAVGRDGSLTVRPKPREPDFASFDEYRDLLTARLASAFANASDHQPLATLSSGYDSTACAAVGKLAGCRRAVTFASGWAWQGFTGTADSGEKAARALGLDLQTFDRLAYRALPDAPDAEFLATGMSGEDVIYRSMEAALPNSVLLTGFWGGAAWRNNDRAQLSRLDLSGASLGELRLRTGFIHIPVAYIGGVNQPSLRRIQKSADMDRYRMGGKYDEPVARRIAEEAGVPRGSFAVVKMATSVRLHTGGLDALSPSGRASFEDFCHTQAPGALERLPERRPIGRRGRLALRVAHSIGADRLTRDIARRRMESVHIEPVLGSLLLRWSVAQVRGRYSTVRGFGLGGRAG